ncbi:MAG: maleylpyruvate isomerase family mycothiol-dependent enzyme [Acidimicrobiales bacterium]
MNRNHPPRNLVTCQALTPIEALAVSHRRLDAVVSSLDDPAIGAPAYPSEWSIAQVLSHLGSGAVITRRRLVAELAGETVPEQFAPSVWDEWDARAERAQVDDGLAADAELLAAFDSVSDTQRAVFSFALGPMSGDFDAFVGLRLNEHALHTWDVEVTEHPDATIPTEIAELVVDNLDLIARFTAQPTPGDPATITVATTGPTRRVAIELTTQGATLATAADGGDADLTLPAEALIRLIYGRLDPDHSPSSVTGDAELLDRLRSTYPGP